MTSPRSSGPDDRFRRQLADLLDTWVEQGLIQPAQRDRLWEYYQLDSLPRTAASRFTLLLLLLGAVLVGLGVISFVAANWDAIPRSARALGSLALTVGLQVAGLRLWQQGSPRLGSALLIAGELALGAAIALMAQWFQMGGSLAGLFLGWGLGSLAVAYSLFHTPSGVLACLLFALAGVTAVWEGGTALDPLYPWLALGLLLPLAYGCRSRWIFALALVDFGLALQRLAERWDSSGEGLTLWLLLGLAVVWGLGFWHQRHGYRLSRILTGENGQDGEQEQGLDLIPTAEGLALLGLGFLLYVWSFRDPWDWDPDPSPLFQAVDPWASLSAAGLLLLAGWGWWQGWQAKRSQPISAWLKDAVVFLSLITLALLLVISNAVSRNLTSRVALAFLAPWILTLLLVGLSAILCWEGLQQGLRGRFWQGLLGLTLVVLTRFFEYETGLLAKSAVLVACGIGVIWVGLKFEQRLNRSLPPAPRP
ncbi:DUF2157 domain-containing protein [Synechococcus sp. H55.8]|uniref:DUF2157 domain-containing protein n=1 Tax=Synechococcus sp. H55.8 TaxID=2964510 RepID=UPI0039C1BA02